MNKYRPHVFVIPEDDANRQIANGFIGHPAVKGEIQVMPPAGGWRVVLQKFVDAYVPKLRTDRNSHVVLLIDLDGEGEFRKAACEQEVPEDLKMRVFVVGSKQTPEKLKQALSMRFEKIGERLAEDCSAGTVACWNHEQLAHNDAERQRLVLTVKPFLF